MLGRQRESRDPITASWAKSDNAPRLVVLAVSFGAFLTSLDAGAVTTDLPVIRHAFAASIDSTQWVLAGELLVVSSLLLVFGRLGDCLGSRRLYLCGFGVFLFGCILCGVASSLGLLVVFRMIQGIGSAMLLANSPAVLTIHLPVGRRGSGFGTKLACVYVGLMAGPALGGWLTDQFGWRAIFAIEAPFAIAGLLISTAFLPRDELSTHQTTYDWAGAGIWVMGFAALVWLTRDHRWRGPYWGWLTGLAVIALLASAVSGPTRRAADPFFHWSCFWRPRFCTCLFSLLIAFTASYTLTFTLAFLLVEEKHESASVAGRVLAIYALARSVGAWWGGRWSDHINARLLAMIGMLLFGCGLAVLSVPSESVSTSSMATGLLMAGAGFGCFVPTNNTALMDSAPPTLYGFAAGMLATARHAGMTAGVALSGAILSIDRTGAVTTAKAAFRIAALLALAGAAVWALPSPRVHRE